MLTERKISLLTDIIQQYIHQAEPVGSQSVVESSKLDLSPATVRNEMLELEKAGYLFQPYTSAGRIPTEKGWRFYLDHILKERPVNQDRQEELRRIIQAFRNSQHELLKHLAQTLAEFTTHAVFVAFSPRDTYYTGISKLFDQPEFEEIDLIRNITRVVDHLDEVMPKFFKKLNRDVTVLLGHDNPFSEQCGLVMTGIPRQSSLLGVLGPIRQDYEYHIALVRFTHSLLATV